MALVLIESPPLTEAPDNFMAIINSGLKRGRASWEEHFSGCRAYGQLYPFFDVPVLSWLKLCTTTSDVGCIFYVPWENGDKNRAILHLVAGGCFKFPIRGRWGWREKLVRNERYLDKVIRQKLLAVRNHLEKLMAR